MAKFLTNGALAEKVATTPSSATTLTLTSTSATIQVITGTIAQNVRLPVASTLAVGMRFDILNRSTQVATVRAGDGITVLGPLQANSQATLRVVDATGINGTWDFGATGPATIGNAEDSSYLDGLYTDFDPTTPTGTAVDRFNQVLLDLVPRPPAQIDHLTTALVGASARLSFGASNAVPGYTDVPSVDLGGLFGPQGDRAGVFTGSQIVTGTLAGNVVATTASPAAAFGSGNLGTLAMAVNGTTVVTVDLTTFGSGSTLNGNGSGLLLSAAASVLFPDGNPFSLYRYRTGTFTVATADQRLGWNVVVLTHTIGFAVHTATSFDWVNDSNAVALSVSTSGIASLVQTGSQYLSGIHYYTGATALYTANVLNVYRDVYSSSATALTYTTTGTTTLAGTSLATPVTEASVLAVSRSITAATQRFLNDLMSVDISVDAPLKAPLVNGGSASVLGLLIDPFIAAGLATAVVEPLADETMRLRSVAAAGTNGYAAQSDATSALNAWDSTESLVGATAGYIDGLLVCAAHLSYPSLTSYCGVATGNFGAVANGQLNPNYTAASGTRGYYRRFQNTTGTTRQNLKINLTGTGTFVPLTTPLTGQNLHIEMKFPTGALSGSTGWLDCYADFLTGQYNDGQGCRFGTAGAGQAFGVDWGLTTGIRCVAASEYIVIRITASASWTGSSTNLTVTWL